MILRLQSAARNTPLHHGLGLLQVRRPIAQLEAPNSDQSAAAVAQEALLKGVECLKTSAQGLLKTNFVSAGTPGVMRLFCTNTAAFLVSVLVN